MSFTLQAPIRRRISEFLVDHRVAISFMIVAALILEDVVFRYKPRELFNFRDPLAAVGLALILFGLTFRSWAGGVLRKGKSLATTGPYRLCRNPLYFGSILMMLGFCSLLGDPKNPVVMLGPVAGIYLLTIHREERRLEERYGAAWREYAAEVPRLFPRMALRKVFGQWSLGQWVRNREYRAVGTTLIALVALQLWARH